MKKLLLILLIPFVLLINEGICERPVGGGGALPLDQSAVAITGGTIDGASIGQTTPAAGSFTSLEASTDPIDANGVGDRGFNDTRYLLERLYPAMLNDTTSPHQLTVTECTNRIITTQGWNGTDDITFVMPDISAYDGTEGVMKGKFLDSVGMQDADTDLYFDPDASTQIVLNGLITGADGDRVWFDNVVIYSSIAFHSEYDPTLGGYWVFDQINGIAADKGS